MKIIAVNPGHNSTVGYFEDGICRNILHEEKFNNIKNYLGMPVQALDYLHKKYDLGKVDAVVFNCQEHLFLVTPSPNKNIVENLSRSKLKDFLFSIEYWTKTKKLFFTLRKLIIHFLISPKAKKVTERYFLEKYHLPASKIFYLDHHTCHCLSGVYFYGLMDKRSDFLLISLDAEGDFLCSRAFVYKHQDQTIKCISLSDYTASVGILYSQITKFLGMKPVEHEYKVMGLSAYVSKEKYFEHILKLLSGIITINLKKMHFESKFNTNASFNFLKKSLVGERFDNIAAAIQKFTELLIVDWVRLLIKKTKIHNIVLSGGVFMNIKVNQKLLELPEVSKIYIQPSSGDDSSILGAAAGIIRTRKEKMSPIKTMFLGNEYSPELVEKFLKEQGYFKKYQVCFFKDIEREIARLLSRQEIVGRFKGAGEWGARSLGNRSILANASNLNSCLEINEMIKMRDFWMPFAPVILEEWAGKYIENWEKIKKKSYDSTKYMIISFSSTLLAQSHLRAAIHQKDKSLRPQIVSSADNPSMYKLLKYFEKTTGMGGMLNTSFNIHGYPLVGTLEQASFSFENSGLKLLAIENYLISKK